MIGKERIKQKTQTWYLLNWDNNRKEKWRISLGTRYKWKQKKKEKKRIRERM
jgi:hypothetical protein